MRESGRRLERARRGRCRSVRRLVLGERLLRAEPVGDDDGSELIDLIGDTKPGPEDILLDREQDSMVTSLLDVLEPRARYAVEQRFGIHDGRKRSYREVGDELGVTAEAARRLVKRAVNTVKEEAAARVDAA